MDAGSQIRQESWPPKECNGESGGFDDFAFKFSNWLSGLPGDAERFLEESANIPEHQIA